MDAVPVAQFVSAADDGQGLVASHFGGSHLHAHIAAGSFLGVGMTERSAVRTTEDNV